MTQLTQLELDELDALVPEDLENFTSSDAIAYYTYLENKGFTYGTMALGVVQNTSVQGKFANTYASMYAESKDISLHVGSENWLNVQYNLMLQDVSERKLADGNDLTAQKYSDIHTLAFSTVSLPPETWTAYVPLQNKGNGKEDTWSDILAEQGVPQSWMPNALRLADASIEVRGDFVKGFVWSSFIIATGLEVLEEDIADYFPQPVDLFIRADGIAELVFAYEVNIHILAERIADSMYGTVGILPTEFQSYLAQFADTRTVKDPLVVDLNKDGHATVVNTGVYFDLDADGNFAEATLNWVSPHDGMIVIDLNENGRADDGSEIFSAAGENAWNQLRVYDTNDDDKIDSGDDDWVLLHVWQDKNSDGYTQSNEWFTLDDLDITAINLPFSGTVGSVTTLAGNLRTDGVVFATDLRNTRYSGDAEVDFTTLFLPNLAGYNHLADLRIGMSLDSSGTGNLLDVVSDLATTSMVDITENLVAFRADFVEMMYQWAGVDGVAPNSRGIHIEDARNLEFLEEYFGGNFIQVRSFIRPEIADGDPLSVAAVAIKNVFNALTDSMMTKFLYQSGALNVFETPGHYDRATDSIVFDGGVTPVLDADKLLALGEAGASAPDVEIYWATLAFFIGKLHGGLSNFTTAELIALNAAVAESDPGMDWGDVDVSLILNAVQNLTGDSTDNMLVGASGGDHLIGLGGADTLTGNDGDDILEGGDGNDLLQGNAGIDQLDGGAGNDTLRDGLGSDLIEGGIGDDVYIWEGGANDFIYDTSGDHDALRIGFGGSTSGNISFERSFNDDLVIRFYTSSAWHTITLQDHLSTTSSDHRIERLEDGAGTLLFDLTDISSKIAINGTNANDTISGADIGPARNDYIDGNAGNDILSGLGGSDDLHGEDGNDTLYGGTGNDTLYGGLGIDHLYGGAGDDTLISDETPLWQNDRAYANYLEGGEGNDQVLGYAGDDHYFYTSGKDTYTDKSGSDIVELSDDYTFSQLQIYRQYEGGTNGQYNLTIRIDDQNNILLQNHFYSLSVPYQPNTVGSFETLRLNDGTSDINLSAYGTDLVTYGSALSDTISGFAGNLDTIYAGSGDDVISTNGGNNDVYGQDGNDIINTITGTDHIYGGQGDDVIAAQLTSAISGNLYHGGELLTDIEEDGSDTVNYSYKTWGSTHGLYVDLSDPEDGYASKILLSNDTLAGAQDTLVSIENIIGTSYDDTLIGNDEANTFNGGAGNDIMQAGDGNDTYVFSGGVDLIEDANGSADVLRMTAAAFSQGVALSQSSDDLILVRGSDQITITDFYNGKTVEFLELDDGTRLDLTDWANWAIGTSAGETLTGTSSADTIIGLAGTDTLNGSAGDDKLYGGDGNDTINGGNDNDIIYGGSGSDTVNAGDGDDVIYGLSDTRDIIDGGNGFDTVNFSNFATHVTLSGTSAYIQGTGTPYSLTSIEKVIGTKFNDTMTGTNNADHLVGGEGNDTLTGLLGSDTLEGGKGNDTYIYNASTGGHIVITDTEGRFDTISISGVTSSSAIQTSVGDNLEITFTGYSGAKITILGQEATGTSKIELLQFSNGSVALVSAENSDPIAQDDLFFATEGETITGNLLSSNGSGSDSDSDNDVLTVTPATITTTNGASVTILSNGNFTYRTDSTYSGTDTFTYTVTDANGGTDTATATVNVTALSQHSPTAQADMITALVNQTAQGNVLADNGSGADGDFDDDTLSVAPATLATSQGGTVVIQANGDFSYTPPSSFIGSDSFEYTVVDSQGGSARAMVTMSVGAPNTAPEAKADEFEGNENEVVTGNVLANNGSGVDLDADSDDISVVAATLTTVAGGTIVIEADGDFTYTPATNFYGVDSFTYVLLDSEDNADLGQVTIAVTESSNSDPIAQDDEFEGDEDAVINGNLLADNGNGVDSDSNGDDLTVDADTFTTTHGATVIIGADGDFSYTPVGNFNGTDTFEYTLLDGLGGTATGTASIIINALNDAPVAKTDAFTANEDTTITGNVLSNNGNGVDTDADADTLTVTPATITTTNGASVTILSNGNFTYIPVANYSGSDSFSYTLNDGTTTTAGTVNLTVTAVNDAPVATNNGASINQDSVLTLTTAMLTASDVDNTTTQRIFTIQTASSHGTFKLNGSALAVNGTFSVDDIATGKVTYTPTTAYSGSDSVILTLSDGTNTLSPLTFNVTVNSLGNPVNGTSGNDTVTGTSAVDVLHGFAGNDTLNGLASNDYLFGDDGNDTLDGGLGTDSMYGGTGNDIYYVNYGDNVFEASGEGTDTVYASDTFGLSSGQHVEVLSASNTASTTGLTLAGSDTNNTIIGTAGSDGLYGYGGNDTLQGGVNIDYLYGGDGDDILDGGTSADNLTGGAGDDAYYVDNASDVVVETTGNGTDTVYALTTYTLGASVYAEYLRASDVGATSAMSLTGNSLDNEIHGNAGVNTLTGAAGNDNLYAYGGNDTLSGGDGNDLLDGGSGADAMTGGSGDDSYYIDNASDTITETTGNGTDSIYTSITYTLSNTAYIEYLRISDVNSTSSINITGNNEANQIYGSAGANSLSGSAGADTIYGYGGNDTLDGGTGNDTLYGGAGDDLYYVNYGDSIYESSGEGTDTVYASETFGLASGQHIEVLSTNNSAGTVSMTLAANEFNNLVVGNAGSNALFGNAGDDTLMGNGGIDYLYSGAGADSLYGGTGADTSIHDNATAFNGMDTFFDFSKTESDKVNIADLLDNYDPLQHNINDFVSLSVSSGNTTLRVDSDGTGSGTTSRDVVKINSQTWSSVADMITNGHLIIND